MKYYRYKCHLSQEKFAEKIDSNLLYINQLEKARRNPSLNMLDKISSKISNLLNYDISSSELISYDKDKEKIVNNYKRIDKQSN